MAVNSLEKLMDVPVDHYIAINMDGVKTVVDEIGGVDITSDATFTTKSTTPFHFDKGKQYHMDGKQALAYMRARKEDGGGDGGRQLRQQQVITCKEAFSMNSVTKLNGIFKAHKIT